MFEKNEQGKQLADIYDRGFKTLYKNGRIKSLAKQYQIPNYSLYYPEIDR
jgi:hypothetical protein